MDTEALETINQLQQELSDVQAALTSKQADLELSATIGKRLLENNHELTCRYEETVRDFTAQLEVGSVLDSSNKLR